MTTFLLACGSRGALAPVAGVALVVDTTLYEVAGRTPREWRVFLRENGQKATGTSYSAFTRSNVRYEYRTRLTTRGCEGKFPRLAVSVQYIMPHRMRDSLVAPALEDEWSRFSRFLWRHEEGHAARAVRAADEMADSLRHLVTPACDSYGAVAARMWTAISRKYTALQVAYDERTRHGVTQGAVLPSVDVIRIPIDTTARDTLP